MTNSRIAFITAVIMAGLIYWLVSCAIESSHRVSLGTDQRSQTKTHWVFVDAETTYYKYMDTVAMMKVCAKYARVPEER